jgi:hypothetical protein
MTNHPLRNLAIIEDAGALRRERVRAARELARWARSDRTSPDDRRGVLEKASALWRELCDSQEPPSLPLFHDRTGAASACTVASLALPEGQRFFRNIPRHGNAEGPDPVKEGSLIRGAFNYTYGSIYEFHLEYPIEGFGVRKDLISIVGSTGERTPLFGWLRKQGAVVWCSRCGLDITYEVSRDCPSRAIRGGAGFRGPSPVG